MSECKNQIISLLNDALSEFSDHKFDNGKFYLDQAITELSNSNKEDRYTCGDCKLKIKCSGKPICYNYPNG